MWNKEEINKVLSEKLLEMFRQYIVIVIVVLVFTLTLIFGRFQPLSQMKNYSCISKITSYYDKYCRWIEYLKNVSKTLESFLFLIWNIEKTIEYFLRMVNKKELFNKMFVLEI